MNWEDLASASRRDSQTELSQWLHSVLWRTWKFTVKLDEAGYVEVKSIPGNDLRYVPASDFGGVNGLLNTLTALRKPRCKNGLPVEIPFQYLKEEAQ